MTTTQPRPPAAPLWPRARHSTTQRALRTRLWSDAEHGPLPLLLLGLTVLTGIVDAVSVLALSRVFVANMTGNVVFVGFAVAGAPGFSLDASVVGLAGFLAGAGMGGRFVVRPRTDRAHLLARASGVEFGLIVAATVVVALSPQTMPTLTRDVVVAALAVALGIQNAVVRRLAVPDLTTTVLTMTLTGIAADLRAGARGPMFTRRILAVAAMLGGALAGAELVLRANAASALTVAAVVSGAVALAAWRTTRRPSAWRTVDQPAAAPRKSTNRLPHPGTSAKVPSDHHGNRVSVGHHVH